MVLPSNFTYPPTHIPTFMVWYFYSTRPTGSAPRHKYPPLSPVTRLISIAGGANGCGVASRLHNARPEAAVSFGTAWPGNRIIASICGFFFTAKLALPLLALAILPGPWRDGRRGRLWGRLTDWAGLGIASRLIMA